MNNIDNTDDDDPLLDGGARLLIGRTDYHVSAIDTLSGAVAWSLSAGE
jgi:hypothetical protein